jgi:hypothetical protein
VCNTRHLLFVNWSLSRGLAPSTPTRNPFEKGFLDFLKLSKRHTYQFFLKVLEGGLGGTSFKKFLPVAPLQTEI